VLTRALIALAVAAAAGLALLDRGDGGERAGPAQGAHVVRVVDGDTIRVDLGAGREEAVRYIGIDTPESVRPGTPVECFAKAASEENRRLVAGRRVRLEFDVERRDRYGRLLAYVHHGDTFVNAELVRRGFARPATFPPNVRHAERFARLGRTAREAGQGLWGRCGRE
jgi:micrococcal nuclease